MDSSPSKRRKISSPTFAVDAPNTAGLPSALNGQITTPTRASFLSPTKASLARFNPGLLPRPRSAGNEAQRPGSQESAGSGQAVTIRRSRSAHGGRAQVNGKGRLSEPPTPARDGEQKADARTGASTKRAVTASPGRTLGGGLAAAPRRRSQIFGQASPPAKAFKPVKEPVIPVSPPDAAKEDQEVAQETIDGQLERELQGSTGRRSTRFAPANEQLNASENVDQGEPDLPPTPTQLGLEALPEAPKGLFSSPSRRPKRKQSSGVKSSPLKPRDSPPKILSKKPRRSSTRIKALVEQSEKAPEPEVEKPTEEVLQKQRIRVELQAQLRKLREDVALCEQVIEREQGSGNSPALDDDAVNRLMYVTNPLIILECRH